MAKRITETKATNHTIDKKSTVFSYFKTTQAQTIFGFFLILFAIFLIVAFISFFFSWELDQSTLAKLTDKKVKSNNLLGKIGASLSDFFIYKGFGIASFLIAFQLLLTGVFILFKKKLSHIIISWNWCFLATLWVSLVTGFFAKKHALFSGIIGSEVNEYLQTFIGKTGLVIVLFFYFLSYIIVKYKLSFEKLFEKLRKKIHALFQSR